MVTQELISYIKTQLSNGNTVDSIKQSLALKNWQQQDIDQAFSLIQQPQIQQPPSQSADNNVSDLTPIQNSSGMGKKSVVPEEIKGFSWAAFLWNWIWAVGNNTWIGLLALLPFIGFIMTFILGFKGSEWAWKNKRWDSVESFNKTQKSWIKWWLIIVLPLIILAFLGIIIVFILVIFDPAGRFHKS